MIKGGNSFARTTTMFEHLEEECERLGNGDGTRRRHSTFSIFTSSFIQNQTVSVQLEREQKLIAKNNVADLQSFLVLAFLFCLTGSVLQNPF